MSAHVYRSFAVEQARAAGYVGFRTTLTKDSMWKVHYEPGDNPADEFAKTVDWARWGEVAWLPTDDPDKPERVGVLIASVTYDELSEEGIVSKGKDGVWIDAGASGTGGSFLVEPEVAELWEQPGAPVVANTRRQGSAAPGAPRERSSVESPVAIVHRIANSMPDAPRKEVIAACVEAGVNKNTAGTQYYHWQKARAAT